MLLLGLLVYLTDRPASHALLMPTMPRLDLWAGRPVFGAMGQWLPSFVHPLAFSLLTAAALPAKSTAATPRYGVCAAWCAVNLLFELGQHAAVREPLAAALLDLPGRTLPARWLASYFLRGTFDVGDLIAAMLGALAAAAVLHLVQPQNGTPPCSVNTAA